MNRTISRILNIAIAIAAMFCSIASAELEEKDFSPEFVAQCKAKAEAGDAEGQTLYGHALGNGYGIASNHVEAVKWYRKAAKQGLPIAQYYLGTCYENGKGIEKDETKAAEWYRKSADQGCAKAQVSLGWCYRHGLGVEKDESKSVEWYRKAADQGYALAQNRLGQCYHYGWGVQKDEAQGFEWYRKAAEQGFVPAQISLAICYEYGTGVEEDAVKAIEWYRKAARSGDLFAFRQLGECYEKGKGGERNESLALEWYEKAANKGDQKSQLAIAEFYRFGKGVKEDKSKAVEWYTKAAQAGNAYAQLQLGKCYLFGIGSMKDESNAVKWLTNASEQGQGEACFILSRCYSLGLGVTRDVEKSAYMRSKATKSWLDEKSLSAETFFHLGWCYHFGIGVSIDKEKASTFFGKSNFYSTLGIYNCNCNREIDLLSVKLGIADYFFLFSILQEYTCAENALNNLSRAPRPFDNEALAGALLCWADSNYMGDTPTSWTTIDGRTYSGKWETCDQSGRIVHIFDGSGYVDLYVSALCEDDKKVVEDKISEFRNNAEYVWKDGYWITKTNLKGIEKAINLINSKSPRGPQHLEIFQITGDYSALALTWKFGLFESPAPPRSPQWPEIEVSAVLVKGNKGSAIVNGQLLDVGNSTFNGAVLRAVTPSGATFEWNGERQNFPVVARRKKTNNQPKTTNSLLNEKELICLTGQNLGAMYAEGEKVNFTNLFWASTYTYETKGGDSKTVGMFTPSFDRAILLVRKALGLFDKTDPVLGDRRPGAASSNTDTPPYNAREEKPRATSFGSGFCISSGGFFLTNFHVVKDASKINILFGESKYQAKCLDYDSDLDIALLKIEITGNVLPFLSFSGRRIANLGEDVYAVGFPRPNLQGASVKVTKGVISSLRGIMDDPHCYQIDASLQPGNSGGPVVDAMGNVIGVSVAQLRGTEAMRNAGDIPQNVNYAIKSSFVMAFLDSTPECAYKTDNRAVKPQASSSGISENVTKACGLVIAYE